MDKKNFTAVLQVALWRYDGMSELEIRQLIAKLVENRIIVAGINLCDFLNEQEVMTQ